ncbi:transposase family protein [Streptomyces collinus]|uniref:helix-turn-helix domain-containing protein n=1 Tax=Streptomyces collinus TaxID=42684 RepID=UPI00342184BA
MAKKWARAALSHPAFTGVSRAHLGGLIEELAEPSQAWRESASHQRRGEKRHRAAGAGRKHESVFTDRVLVALVHLRSQLPHAALAELYGVGRSTVTEAIGEIRPLLADRGFAVPGQSGLRLRTLADMSHRSARSPPPHRRRAGRTLWSGADRPGRMHDQTAMRTEGIAERFRLHPDVRAEVDEGYRGLANELPEQVSAPPKKPKEDAPLGDQYEYKQWRPLQRFLGRREHYPATDRAIAGLVSDRAAQRPTRRKPSTELVPVTPMTC